MTNIQTSAAKLYHELYLEIQHTNADIAYSMATSFCDDCPHRDWESYRPETYSEMEFGVHIAESCCQEEPDYWAAQTEHIELCEQIMAQLKILAGDEEIAAAQSKVSRH